MTPSGERGDPADRVKKTLRRGSEAEARIARSLGEPAIFAIVLSAVGSSLFFVLGIVADDALGLTPLVFLGAGVFFIVTMLTYVEGTSLHTERGGASALARYAFDELWSFVAGWAILLDFVIVLAIGAFAVPHYLAAFWGVPADGLAELAITAAVIGYVAWANFRGISGERYRFVLRLSLLSMVLFAAIVVVGLAQLFDLSVITDSVDLGERPELQDVIFATVVAAVACTGIDAASGLAGDIRVGRRGLRRLTMVVGAAVLILLVSMSALALMAVPVGPDGTRLGGEFLEAPVLGVVSAFDPPWLADAFRYAVGAVAALVLVQAANGQMLGIGRLVYSLGTHRQIPSVLSRLDDRYSTPFVTIWLAAAIAFCLALTQDVEFLAGLFAFGAMLAFTIAHLSVIVLRFREPDRPSAFRVPLNVIIRGAAVPLPAVLGALMAAVGLVNVIVLHEGARIAGGVWMAIGLTLYVVYRRSQGKSLTKRFTIPPEALREFKEPAYGSILVPVLGVPLDDDIVGTAGRLAAERAEEGEGGAVLEALYVFEVPMSLPIDARIPEEKLEKARRALNRAKGVGEEYAGVEVATAMVRGRTLGSAIVEEAKRRGVEAIVLAAEEPSKVRGGGGLGGLGRVRDRFAGEMTKYVIEKAPCKVILTAPPAGAEPKGSGPDGAGPEAAEPDDGAPAAEGSGRSAPPA